MDCSFEQQQQVVAEHSNIGVIIYIDQRRKYNERSRITSPTTRSIYQGQELEDRVGSVQSECKVVAFVVTVLPR